MILFKQEDEMEENLRTYPEITDGCFPKYDSIPADADLMPEIYPEKIFTEK